MATKFKISTDARAILMKDPDIQSKVAERIYPCVAPSDTTQDYIVYFRDAYGIDSTKMGIYSQVATVMFVVISSDYERSQEIAEAVFNALQGKHDGVSYNMDDSTEDYIDKKYFQFLLFKIN